MTGASAGAAPWDSRLDRRTGRALLRWFRRHRRPLPWRVHPNPYRIWVAEVLLQQTRVAQAIPYYERFLRRFPNVRALAGASEQEVLKAWEGAGYYARARHLREAARRVVREHGGHLPRRPEELARLPGVGPYIAAAVASLAFGYPALALDANALRVAARWSAETRDLRRPLVRRALERTLERTRPPLATGAFNEALMELGETICRPVGPVCPECPVAVFCRARQLLPDPGSIPRRRRRTNPPLVRAAVVAVRSGGRWLVHRRPSSGLLGGMWELPGGKLRPGESPAQGAARELREETGMRTRTLRRVGVVNHRYSHFRLRLHVFFLRSAHRLGPSRLPSSAMRWVTDDQWSRLPRPRATVKAMALVERLPGLRQKLARIE